MQVVFRFFAECGAAFLAIMFIITIYSSATSNGISSNCTTENVFVNESGNITCHFSEDITITRTSVLVKIIKEGNNSDRMVCMYSWYDGNEVPNITDAPGYDCRGNLTTAVVIKIPRAAYNNSGIYKCVVFAFDGAQFKSCNLTVEEKSQDYNNGDDSLDRTTKKSQDSNNGDHSLDRTTKKFQDSNNGDHSWDRTTVIGIVVGVVVGVAVVVFIILMIVPKSRNWIRSRIPACCCGNRDPGLQGSGSATSKVTVTNENQDKTETDKLITVVQMDTASNEKLEKKETEDLPKPLQEKTEVNEEQEKRDY